MHWWEMEKWILDKKKKKKEKKRRRRGKKKLFVLTNQYFAYFEEFYLRELHS